MCTDSDGEWISIKQKKTRDELRVPMLAPAVAIYEKYKGQDKDGFVLPRICSQKANTYIKIIADMVGIKKRLTHHRARHTFETQSRSKRELISRLYPNCWSTPL